MIIEESNEIELHRINSFKIDFESAIQELMNTH